MAATYSRAYDDARLTAQAAVSPGDVWQLPDGRCAVLDPAGAALTSGDRGQFKAAGQWTMPKASGVVLLDGGRAYWDRSAGNVTYKRSSDRDFYVGRVVGDAASADTTCAVNLNIDPPYDLDLARDAYTTAPVGTQALGGFLPPQRDGGTLRLTLDSTNEAQKADSLSAESFALGARAVVEMAFRVISDGSGTNPDFNLGIASDTHATDADSIAQHLFVHLNGNAADIYLQSKDGTTTVSATDTTVNYTEGAAVANRVEVWFDLRNTADVQVYVNGALVLGSTVFDVSAAASEWKLLAHLEKTSSTDTYEVAVDWLRARTAEQRG